MVSLRDELLINLTFLSSDRQQTKTKIRRRHKFTPQASTKHRSDWRKMTFKLYPCCLRCSSLLYFLVKGAKVSCRHSSANDHSFFKKSLHVDVSNQRTSSSNLSQILTRLLIRCQRKLNVQREIIGGKYLEHVTSGFFLSIKDLQ